MKHERFIRGDIVDVCKVMPPSMKHFDCGFRGIVLYSYHSEYGSGDIYSLGLLNLKTGGESAWYHHSQLTFVKHINESSIEKIKARKKPIWDRREARIRKKNDKYLHKILTMKNKLPEGTLGRMYQDAFEETVLGSLIMKGKTI